MYINISYATIYCTILYMLSFIMHIYIYVSNFQLFSLVSKPASYATGLLLRVSQTQDEQILCLSMGGANDNNSQCIVLHPEGAAFINSDHRKINKQVNVNPVLLVISWFVGINRYRLKKKTHTLSMRSRCADDGGKVTLRETVLQMMVQ